MKPRTQLAAWLSSSIAIALSAPTTAQTVLLEVGGTLPGEGLGTSVARIGDLNGDGRDDVAVGAPGYGGGFGRVQILSGLDGSALLEVVGPWGRPTLRGVHRRRRGCQR